MRAGKLARSERSTVGEMEIRFDDLDALAAAATEEYGAWGPALEVTQQLIQDFAELSGDHQWIHVDVERALRESPFGGPIAHGFLTLAVLPRVRPPETVKIVGYRNAVNYGIERLRFLAPVPAGARIHARSKLVGAEAHKRGTLVRSDISAQCVDAERPSLLYQSLILYQG
jgi:acyl dehydratase